ncbi:MAG TPA: bifunctional DNA-formamidopyrimidine glycosylase/DNA-(apurinic or apyrimidinic site) lyase, partial [Actinomycetes bacterium]|nr:bifunctional DNA-formamidopyrimidine glycosylase/DNA-(apurinic or apyrimidinic site) lyase [Actinomycetes bacterium]
MPELPEVEVVRRGLDRWAAGRTVAAAEVAHPRAVRRHAAGAADFAARLTGRTLAGAQRRGKYLWLPLEAVPGIDGTDTGEAVLAHLGMSGQLLVRPADASDEVHLRVRLSFTDGGPELRFVDQRTFGGLALVDTDPAGLPLPVAHIARDPLDPEFDDAAFAAALRRRRTGLKRALLDQTLVSGIGNIYADEALWRARLHWARPTSTMTRARSAEVLAAARAVMVEAL